MKRAAIFLLAVIMMISMTACGNSREVAADDTSSVQDTDTRKGDASNSMAGSASADSSDPDGESDGPADPSRILIAYFSWADNAILADDVDAVTSPSVIPPGNVQQLAGWVQDETGGDLFSIQVADKYPSDWDDCLDRANQERGEDARPELVADVDNLDQYDVVFLGYPNWWYGVPMPLLTFLDNNDLSGKQVYLFCSHGTGGLANSVDIITENAEGANISDNIFDCYEEDASGSQDDILEWLSGIGY